jgi:hypothetical protein
MGRISNIVGFEVFTAVTIKIPFFLDVTPCSPDFLALYHRKKVIFSVAVFPLWTEKPIQLDTWMLVWWNILHFEQIICATPFVCRVLTTWRRSGPLAMCFHYNWWSNLSGHMRVEVIYAPINLMVNFDAAHCYVDTYLPNSTVSCPGNTIILQDNRWRQQGVPLLSEQLTPAKSDFSSCLIFPVAFISRHRQILEY